MHPKDKIKEVIQNQTLSQKLEGLIVQGQEERSIHRQPKQCVVFRHEEFGVQPLWCLPKYIKSKLEGPPEAFFAASLESPPTGIVDGNESAPHVGVNNNNNNATAARAPEDEEDAELPLVLQRMVEIFTRRLDKDDVRMAVAAAPMVDNDNMPAPKNIPQPNKETNPNDIMVGWQHSGICERQTAVTNNRKPTIINLP